MNNQFLCSGLFSAMWLKKWACLVGFGGNMQLCTAAPDWVFHVLILGTVLGSP